jgi:hypothetical protein
MSAPRGIRNHNPGNIIDLGTAWDGLATGSDRTESQRNEGRFCVFTAPWYGIRAMAKVLIRYHGHHNLKTVAGMVKRYAPGHENPTDSYTDAVAAALRVQANSNFELNYHNLETMIRTMIKFENGMNPYTWEIPTGLIMAGLGPHATVLDDGQLLYNFRPAP